MREVDSELEKVIAGCLNNSRVSQRELYDRFASKMFAVCKRYASSDTEAEDMLMEGFMEVFKSISTFKKGSAFSTWIHSVMVNTAISHYRSVRRFRNELSETDLEFEIEASEDEKITTSLDAQLVLEVLQKMPDPQRTVFNMRVIDGYSFAEIAEELGKKEETMRVTYLRARKWLQAQLGESQES